MNHQIRNFSLRDFQQMNARIYLVQNDRNYNAADMVSRMGRYGAHILKAVRKNKHQSIARDLCMAFSWTMALGNRFHLDIEEETWKRFPGVCPYCASAPCLGAQCKQRGVESRMEEVKATRVCPGSLREFQFMFAGIYPHNTVGGASAHLAEEATEVSEAVDEFMGTHDQSLFAKITEELVDVVTNQLAVATCLKIDLALEMDHIFHKGCPECLAVPCICGFVIHAAEARSVTVKA